MSYTPTEQELCPSILKIIEGIDEFNDAVRERTGVPAAWQRDHLNEITNLSCELVRLRTRLAVLSGETC